MTDRWEQKLQDFTDQSMMRTDPLCQMQMSMFRRWLVAVDNAMADEGVNHEVRNRIANRLVYGAPHAADAYERIHMQDVLRAEVMNRPPAFFMPKDT